MTRVLSFIATFLLIACQQPGDGPIFKDVLPDSNGGRLDVMVIANDANWEDTPGEVLRKYITTPQAGLPQPEPLFTVRQVEPKSFSQLLKRARNLIVLKIGEPAFSIKENKYAKPQILVTITARDKNGLAETIAENHEKITSTIRQAEIDYLQKRLTKKYQEPTEIMSTRDFEVKVPADYELEYTTKYLAVYWKKGLRSDQGIIMYTEPLPAEDGVLGDRIIPLRDSLTQLYIPGEKEGSYMKVEDLLPPKFENRQLDGHFCIETRGLWRTVNDFMGGAFINYTIFDEENNQRIMLDGFVYAPELNKRNMLLEMEAILQTFESTN